MTSKTTILLWAAAPLILSPSPNQAAETHLVHVNADGSFTPHRVEIRDGDTVEWQFSTRGDAIVPIYSPTNGCRSYKAYDPTDPNEFTGPLPRAASGIFTLGPDGTGLTEQTLTPQQVANLPPDIEPIHDNDLYLMPQGDAYATLDSTWESPNVTGTFIRLRWNTIQPYGPDHFDWSIMDREIEKAVANGKLYSLSFKAGAEGTPDWIFEPTADPLRVPKLTFQDHAGAEGPQCGQVIELGSPTNANYQALYFALWQAAAERIRSRNAWYRALAYVKPSGANLFSHENRLPNACDNGCSICNPQVWAEEGEYTPSALYEFYSRQTAMLAQEFPDKEMSYQLIQAGFPLVNEAGEYEGQNPRSSSLPGVTEQTNFILQQGWAEHGTRFVVAHNGLGPLPQERANPLPPCAHEGVHPLPSPPFASAGSGCPNRFVLEASVRGCLTGFQTENSSKSVSNPSELESTFKNAWHNSDAIYVEIYENRFWEAEHSPGAMEDSIGTWAERFHDRRRTMWSNMPDPFPLSHEHTFTRTLESETDPQILYYTRGSNRCPADPRTIGEIVILGDGAIAPTVKIGIAHRVGKDSISLRIDGTPNYNIRIESSRDLQTWQPVQVVSNPTGTIVVHDEQAPSDKVFYRALLLNR